MAGDLNVTYLPHAKPAARFCSHCPERLKAARHGRDQARHRSIEAHLRAHLARDESLLRQKEALLRRQELLRRESEHRLMNNLQMVVSLLSLQSRTEASAEAASHLSVAANRVAAIARIHRHLHSADGQQNVALKQYLNELCRDYTSLLAVQNADDRAIDVEGIEISVPTAVGVPLGLIVNELVTNAIKHGKGRISVGLERQADGSHALLVCNDGSVLPDGFDPAASRGLGMRLVSSLVAQIGGALRIDRGADGTGMRFSVLFSDPGTLPC